MYTDKLTLVWTFVGRFKIWPVFFFFEFIGTVFFFNLLQFLTTARRVGDFVSRERQKQYLLLGPDVTLR